MRCTCLHTACTSAAPEAMSTTCAVPRSPSLCSSVNATQRSLGDIDTCRAKGVAQGFGSSQTPREPRHAAQSSWHLQGEEGSTESMCVYLGGSGR